MKILLIFLVCLKAVSAVAEDKLVCDAFELFDQVCHLQVGNVQLELTGENILVIQDKKVRMAPTPFQSNQSEWESAEIKKIKTAVVLELTAWDKPENLGQDLKLSVLQLKDSNLKPVSVKTLQKKVWNQSKSDFTVSPKKDFIVSVDESGTAQVGL